jgi:hypothetical protein
LSDDGAPDVHVELAREPTAEEQDLLDTVIHQAIARLRARIRGDG